MKKTNAKFHFVGFLSKNLMCKFNKTSLKAIAKLIPMTLEQFSNKDRNINVGIFVSLYDILKGKKRMVIRSQFNLA